MSVESQLFDELGISSDSILEQARVVLAEDVGSGDLSAQLVNSEVKQAKVISRQKAVVCGRAWFDAVFQCIDPKLSVDWLVTDGQLVDVNDDICFIEGDVRSILTAERCALNFLQTLSGTATVTARWVQLLSKYETRLLDTRKTIPGLRLAQKYAVRCGGGYNHRLGLYDGILIKENHLAAFDGDLARAYAYFRQLHGDVFIEIEVESFEQLEQAVVVKPDRIMLDNFSCVDVVQAVQFVDGRVPVEVSGISVEQLVDVAEAGADFVSVGALTKHVEAVDYSLRVVE